MVLVIDQKRCVRCGNCEAWLPKIMARISMGYFPLNQNNPQVDLEAINKAVESCPLDALTLED